jgi:YidC/Oxa1 family membrane protein insertase
MIPFLLTAPAAVSAATGTPLRAIGKPTRVSPVLHTLSILTPIENVLEDVLFWLHSTLNLTWAWSIIALTIVVRLAILPLTAKQTRSSLAMQRLQPYLKQLQQKYKDDRAALNQAMMEFYRDNKVNPLASCLPLLIQLPIFLALFFVLRDFEPPADASQDLSFFFGQVNILDPINGAGIWGWLLLAIYIASQMLSAVTMMTTPNKQQKLIFMLLPFMIAPFILSFPIGVMLYWITTNIFSIVQYQAIVRLSSSNHEVVLPADTKGRKKVITPKASKQGQTTRSSDRDAAPPKAAPPRKNKRRR